MASTDAWLDRGQLERDTLHRLIEDQAVSVAVYRRTGQPATAGLTEEVNDGELLRTIVVRLDPRGTDTIGLTEDTDVRRNDLWRYADLTNTPRWYRVVSTTRTQSTSDVLLEELER